MVWIDKCIFIFIRIIFRPLIKLGTEFKSGIKKMLKRLAAAY